MSIASLLRNQKGQTLVEVVLAIAVASLVLIALTRATTVALRNAQFAKNQALATQYAQEGMELLRKCRDQNPDDFWNKNCSLPVLGGEFDREVEWSEIDPGEKMQVSVTVSWNSHQSKLVSYLTKWK